MPISERLRESIVQVRDAWLEPATRRVLEMIALVAALAFLPELAAARAHAVISPHPGWIAVVALAARYGGSGFMAGLTAAAAAVGIASVLGGLGLAAALEHLETAPNVIALGASMMVSWVGSWHLRREEALRERLRAASDRATGAETINRALHDVVSRLRLRVDRTSTSLTFLREAAERLEGADPVAAAEAAADLALARTGGSAAAVKVGIGEHQRLLAIRDARGPAGLAPLELRAADLLVPIRNGSDRIGVLVLWGIAPATLDHATTHDLEIIASWCMRALAITAWRPQESGGDALGVR